MHQKDMAMNVLLLYENNENEKPLEYFQTTKLRTTNFDFEKKYFSEPFSYSLTSFLSYLNFLFYLFGTRYFLYSASIVISSKSLKLKTESTGLKYQFHF